MGASSNNVFLREIKILKHVSRNILQVPTKKSHNGAVSPHGDIASLCGDVAVLPPVSVRQCDGFAQ